MKVWCMRIVCWIAKDTDTHTEYVLLFHCNNGCTNAPHCFVYTYIACIVEIKPFGTCSYHRDWKDQLCEDGVKRVALNTWKSHSVVVDWNVRGRNVTGYKIIRTCFTRPLLFRVVTQPLVVIPYRTIGPIYKGRESKKDSWRRDR